MNAPTTQVLDGSATPAAAKKLRVVIIYETVEDGIRGKVYGDRLIEKAAGGRELAASANLWSLKVMAMPEILYLAANAAATADLVIFSATDTQTVPRQLRDWLGLWSDLASGREMFLVALFANQVDGNAPVRDELQWAAMRAGISFYFRAGFGGGTASYREPERSARDGTPGPNGSKRVLIVDDDHCSCILAKKILEVLGFSSDIALNGAEAVETFAPGKYSAVLMDVTMPMMDGLEATAIIRGIEEVEGGHVPIIAMTANVMSGDRERCLMAGIDEYLAKPFHITELADKLQMSQPHSHVVAFEL